MIIDIVIANPPYNKGIDIEFMYRGFNLATSQCVFITPAKWQTAKDDQLINSSITYAQFRESINSNIQTIIYYPCCRDIFNIMQVDGITILHLSKHISCQQHHLPLIINKSKYLKYFNCQSVRDIKYPMTLWNRGKEVIDYIGNYEKFTFSKLSTMGRYEVWVNKKVSGGGLAPLESNRRVLIIGEAVICEYDTPDYSKYINPSQVKVFASNSKEECESFISWLGTAFVQFFVAINISKLTGILEDNVFRYVPVPLTDSNGNYLWTQKYTSTLLYELYGLNKPDALTSDHIPYITIIESLTKDRPL